MNDTHLLLNLEYLFILEIFSLFGRYLDFFVLFLLVEHVLIDGHFDVLSICLHFDFFQFHFLMHLLIQLFQIVNISLS